MKIHELYFRRLGMNIFDSLLSEVMKMIERIKEKQVHVGVFAVAHDTYWAQFPGLREKIDGYHGELIQKLEGMGAEVRDYGMVDSNAEAYAIAERMGGDSLDVLFCNMTTYATSSVFAPIMRAAQMPVVLVALQPRKAMDYTNANTFMQLENDNICSVPEFSGVAVRLGKKLADIILGTLREDREADAALASWCSVGKALHALRGARIGLMGHVLEAMYDMHADPTAVSAAFGLHIPLLEPDDLLAQYQKVTQEETDRYADLIQKEFYMADPESDPLTQKLTRDDLVAAAKGSAALERFQKKYALDGLAYYFEGMEGSPLRKLAGSLIVGNSILIARGIPMCGEYDIKTCIAMLIFDSIGIGGSFAEMHPFDFDDDCILVGHDGPHHIQLAQNKPVLRSLSKYHGKPGSGASVEFKLKEGPVTMLGITQKKDGSFKFVIGEGISREGAIPPTGNTNTRCSFLPDTKTFIKAWCMEGPTHHFALGLGHHGETIKRLGEALGIESVIVKG